MKSNCHTNNLIVKHNGECRMWKYSLIALIGIVSGIRASYDGAGCALSLLEGKDGHLVMIAGEKHASSGSLPFHSEYKSLVTSHISRMVSATDVVILYEASKPRVGCTHNRFYKEIGDKPLEEALDDTVLFPLLTLCIPGEKNSLHNEIVQSCNFPDNIHEHLCPCDVRFGPCEVIIDVFYYRIERDAKRFKDAVLELVSNNHQLYSSIEKLSAIECTEKALYGTLRTRLAQYGIDCEELTELWRSYLEKYEYDFFGEKVTFAALYEHFEWLKECALENSNDCVLMHNYKEAKYWLRFHDYFDTLFEQLCTIFEISSQEDLNCSWIDVFKRYCNKHKSIGTELGGKSIFHDFSVRVADFGVLHRIFTARKDNQPVFVIIGDEHRKTLLQSLKKLGYMHLHTEFAPCYREDDSRKAYLYPEQYDEIFNRFYAAYFNIPGNKEYIKTDVGLMYPVPVEKALKCLCENE